MLMVEYDHRLSTIQAAVTALDIETRRLRLPEVRGDPIIQHALRAAGHEAPLDVRQALPISARLLRSMLWSMLRRLRAELGRWRESRDAAMLVGWAGMLRVSELVAVRWEYVSFLPRGAMIFIPKSKTDPGERQWVFLAEGGSAGAAAGVWTLSGRCCSCASCRARRGMFSGRSSTSSGRWLRGRSTFGCAGPYETRV